MAPRTLSSTWRHFERLARAYFRAEGPRTEAWNDIAELTEKVNTSRITDALATMFVNPYQGLEETGVRFTVGENGEPPDWTTAFFPEENVIRVNPLAVVAFHGECEDAVEALKTPSGRRDFQTYRFHAYMAELRKLPSQHILFLMVLREVARARRITAVEKKGGGVEEVEDEAYMRLLWAFKELETFVKQMQGVSLRSEYRILWYESDWIVGKK